MYKYRSYLKPYARKLRRNQTDAEQLLWSKLRRKQVHGITINRQKPIGLYIVDFYCHTAKMVIEIDGGQHYERNGASIDSERDRLFENLGLKVLRFSNREVFQELDWVLESIYSEVFVRVNRYEPLNPP